MIEVTLNHKSICFPKKSKATEPFIIQEIPTHKTVMILKDFKTNQPNFWLIINFFSKKGLAKTYHRITGYTKIHLDENITSYEIDLHPNSIDAGGEVNFVIDFE